MAAHVMVASWQLEKKSEPDAIIHANRMVPEWRGAIFDVLFRDPAKIDRVFAGTFYTPEAAIEFCNKRGWSYEKTF